MAKNTDTAKEPETGMEYDPWKDMRKVYIPKRSRTEQDTMEVGVNDRTFFVPKDQFVEVPAPVWEVVEEMLARQKEMESNAKQSSGMREVSISHI